MDSSTVPQDFFKNNIDALRALQQDYGFKAVRFSKHMMHPFEDYELSFEDMKDMVKRIFDTNLSDVGYDYEKIDGVALSFTIKDGKILLARNSKHIKNEAQGALTKEDIPNFFSGKPFVIKAITTAYDILAENFISYAEFFKEGKVFISMDVVNNLTENVIKYPDNRLYFHGCHEYDIDGNMVDKNFVDLYTKFYNVSIDKKISFPNKVQYDRSAMNLSKRENFLKKLNFFTDEYYCNNIFEYLALCFAYLFMNDKRFLIDKIEDAILLAFRLMINRNIFRMEDIKRRYGNGTALNILDFEKNEYFQQKRVFRKYIETIIFSFGEFIKSTVTNYISAETESDMADRLMIAIDNVSEKVESSDEKIKRNFDYNYDMLFSGLGGIEKITPMEGIVYMYKGKTYKLTGKFSCVNQILGTFRY